MHEWDETGCWRRIRILAIREAAEGGGMQEVDGWMLLESAAVGRLLEEVHEGKSCCIQYMERYIMIVCI